MPKAKRVSAVGLVALLLVAIAVASTPFVARLQSAMVLEPGDTVTVYGPHRFSTPTGSTTVGVESFTLSVQPAHQYLVQLANGNANGSNRVSTGAVELNGHTVITAADVGSAYSGVRVIQVLPNDTLKVTVSGSAGSFVDVSVLEVTDPTFAVYGPATFVRGQGQPQTESFAFDLPSGAGAPFYLSLINGRTDGTKGTSSATVVINAQTVVSGSDLNQHVGGFVKQVTLQSHNSVTVTVASVPSSEVTLTFLATDAGAPMLTITAPAQNLITRDATVAVTGTVTDQTATSVFVNGTLATRSGNDYSANASLTEGSTTILVHAVDAAGNATDSTRTVTRDSQAPTLTVTAPTEGLITNSATITVSGTVSDATTTTVNVNGTQLPVTNGAFTGSITATEGANFITVTATDAAGNATSVARHVTLDTQPPAIVLNAPADGAITNQTSIAISGTVTDATPVTLTVNGTPVTPAANGAFTTTVSLGAEGSNAITVSATDAASNNSQATRNVIRDTQAPALTVSSPAVHFVTNQGTATITGTVTDQTALTLSVNGAPVTIGGDGSFSSTVTLSSEGDNAFAIVATDAATNHSDVTRTVIHDTQAPVITVTAPADNAVTNHGSVHVTGTVTDLTTTTVTVNGATATLGAGGSFDVELTLGTEGANNITVSATDEASNASSASRTVIRDTQFPTLTVASPAAHFATNQASATITGSVVDATAVTLTLNGAPVTVNGNGSFSTTVNVTTEGNNAFTLIATDAATNETQTLRTIILDTHAPDLTVTAPSNGTITNANSVHVTGTVTDLTAVALSVNGVAATVAQDGSFDATVSLGTEGNVQIDVAATDEAGNRSTQSRSIVRDTQAPTLSVTAPVDGSFTNTTTVHVIGSALDATAVAVDVNGVPTPVSGSGAFDATVSLTTEGANPILVRATDAAGNTVATTRTVNRDTQAPVVSVTSPANGFTTPLPNVTVSGTVSDGSSATVTVNGTPVTLSGSSFSTNVALTVGPNTVTIVSTDAAGNVTTATRSVTRSSMDPQLVESAPIDNTLGAPAPAAGFATNVSSSTRFLYEGPNAVQTGVQPGAIQPLRVGVVRGRVSDVDGNPLAGVTVKVAGKPELGQTQTRANGQFDMAVNGFGLLTINLSKTGYPPVARDVNVTPLDYAPVSEIVMTQLDTIVTTISFTQPIEVARGSTRSDADGVRTQRLLFQQGTVAKLVMPNGDSVPLTGPVHVRATEFTVGPNGPKAMPASLPATSGYTYAAELSLDEGIAAGATSVAFSKTVWSYKENFLNLPVGSAMPSAYYDFAKRVWVGQGNGRIIKVLNIDNGVATLDVTGSGAASPADTLTAMDFTTPELQQLAQLYQAGQSLWRMPVTHFSPNDDNSPIMCGFPGGNCARPKLKPRNPKSNVSDPNSKPDQNPDSPDCVRGSVINCQRQTLGEMIPVVGTPYNLTYETSRARGFRAAYILDIPVADGAGFSDSTIVSINVAGRGFTRRFASPPAVYRFEWDGLDAYGRPVIGQQRVSISVGYGYPVAFPYISYEKQLNWFGQWVSLPIIRTARYLQYYTTSWEDNIGPWDARGDGLGGWTLDNHHVLDVQSHRVMKGDGSQVQGSETVRATIRTVAGVANVSGFSGDGGPADKAAIAHGDDFVFGPDGALYLTGNFRIRRVSPDGIIQTIAGTGSATSSPDGALARLTGMNATKVQFLPDGTAIFYDTQLGTIRRIGTDSIVRKYAGGGTSTAEGATALETNLNSITDMIAGADGAVYYLQSNKVRMITPGGLAFTVAGTGTCTPSAPAEGVARDMPLCFPAFASFNSALTFGPDGALYLLIGNNEVRRLATDGRLTRYAFGGTGMQSPMGAVALAASVGTIRSIYVGPDGTLYWADNVNNLRAVAPDGIMRQVAGTLNGFLSPVEGAFATVDYVGAGHHMQIGPDGSLFAGEGARRIRRIGTPFPGLAAGDIPIASPDASEVYIFSGEGQHKRTVDGTTGVTLVSFAYDAAGRIASVTDRDGLVTTVERDASGTPTAIVAPFGQRTVVALDADGMLASVLPPATSAYTMTYGLTGRSGILTSFVEPGTGTHTFAYDSLAKLISDSDASGTQTLARVAISNGYRVTRVDAANVATVHDVTGQANGDNLQIQTNAGASRPDTSFFHPEGGSDLSVADGTAIRNRVRADPRFGATSAYTTNLLITSPGVPQTLVQRGVGATLALSGDLLKPAKLADSVFFGVGVNTNISVTTWDAPTRSIVYQSPVLRRDSTFLDTLGRVIRVRPRGLASATLTYDTFGRVRQTTHGGRVTRFTFDQAGLIDTVIDPLNFRTRFAYDAAGRPTTITRPDGQSISMAYDSFGRLSGITPPGRPQHQFSYTPAGLLDTYTPPSVSGVADPATRYSYDAARLTKVKRPTGDSLTFGYDAAGRPSTLSFFDGTSYGTTTTSYNATTGRPSFITTNAGGTQSLGMTFGGPFLTNVTQSGQVGGGVTFGYDVQLRLSSTSTGPFTSELTAIEYDKDDLLSRVALFGVAEILYTRAAQTGLISSIGFHGVNNALTYDSLGALSSDSVTRSGSTLYNYRFTRDNLDRITTKTETIQGVTTVWGFAYDSAGRLASVTLNGSPSASYAYDANGNRLSRMTSGGTESGVYDDQDRVVSYGTATYLHNAAGELSHKIVGTDTTRYTYDALGALRQVKLGNGTQIDYVIDPLGRRVGRKVNGAFTHRFVYESDLRIAAELDASGNRTTRYVYGTRVNVPEFMNRAGQVYRFVTDHLGSVRLVVRISDGFVAQRIDYDEFGRVTFNSAPGFQPFGYAGGLVDDLTGLVKFGRRDFDPSVGRWNTIDAISFGSGVTNLYVYADDDPINSSDPLGLCVSRDDPADNPGSPEWYAKRIASGEGNNVLNNIGGVLSTCNESIACQMVLDVASLGGDILERKFGTKAVEEITYLYQKVGAAGEHLKFGITKNPTARYTLDELAGGRLRIIAQGARKEMLRLERKLHESLPIGPEEAQRFYTRKQAEKGLRTPPYIP